MARRDTARWLTTLALCAAVLATFRVADAARSSVGFRDGGLHHPRGGLGGLDRADRLDAGGRGENPGGGERGGAGEGSRGFLPAPHFLQASRKCGAGRQCGDGAAANAGA